MASRTQIQIQFDEFESACAHSSKGMRVPGANAQIPSDTLLSADPEGILVETFAVATSVAANKRWIFNASVDAKKLIKLCGVLKKLGAKGHAVYADISGRDFVLTFETTRLSVPTFWIK